jgi:hypothetical protein
MTYILFTILFLNGRVTMSSQEFNSEKACTDAGAEVKKQLEPYAKSYSTPSLFSSTFCVPK